MNRAETERVYIDLKFAQAKLATTAVKIRAALDSGMPRSHRDDYLREARYWLGEAMIATGRAEHRLGLHTTLEPIDDVDYHSRTDDVTEARQLREGPSIYPGIAERTAYDRMMERGTYQSMWADFREWLYDWWWLRVRRSPSRGLVIGYRKAERAAQRKGRP